MTEMYGRRSVLRTIAACACCLPAATRLLAAEKGHPHWGYDGNNGPDRWGKLSPDFKTCEFGTQQTPIDLTDGIRAETGTALDLDYRAVSGKILNDGHTIQVDVGEGCSCTIDGTRFNLAQFHFHHPSEHLLSGKAEAMEVHFVHKSASGALAVVGVFIRQGHENKALQPIFDQMPEKPTPAKTLSGTIDPASLLPAASANGNRPFYRYMGSLTTPPCSEGLVWTVFETPIEASPDQIKRFSALFPNNARPVKELNRRFLLQFGS